MGTGYTIDNNVLKDSVPGPGHLDVVAGYFYACLSWTAIAGAANPPDDVLQPVKDKPSWDKGIVVGNKAKEDFAHAKAAYAHAGIIVRADDCGRRMLHINKVLGTVNDMEIKKKGWNEYKYRLQNLYTKRKDISRTR